jgi:alanyl-tRNA synthetase
MITVNELRAKYIEFFKERGHAQISGRSLIPENDPTVLFTTAGMHPLVPYILGEAHPAGTRLTDYQKCIRTVDIDAVGDTSHLTFFEMLGNWSLGDYFKNEAIAFSYEFLTSSRWLGIDPARLSVTVFAGEGAVPADEESAEIWRKLGIPRIHYLGRDDNWWGPAGQTGPCGPDTEMFIDTGKPACGPTCAPGGCKCGRWFEVWNDVFLQYNKTADGRFEPLGRSTVDTGMGVERTVAMLQGKSSVYDIEVFVPVREDLQRQASAPYGRDEGTDRSYRIILDHVRAAVFMLGDEAAIKPSNIGQGYVLRRLIRRAVRHGRKLGLEGQVLVPVAERFVDVYRDTYRELESRRTEIIGELAQEGERFLDTLKKGEHEFEKLLPNLLKNPAKTIPGRVAFRLYDTYGFPIELTEELAAENGLQVDRPGFDEAFGKHQDLSRSGSEQTFKGGLADHGLEARKLHTATHLLHKALRMVLGDHVAQKGSNITSERLRFDFSHPEPMTPEQIKEVERIVNGQIARSLPVSFEVMTLDQARESGATALFGERYGEKVKVYTMGDFSKEVCGGPHVENTRELGGFKIQKEQSSSAGVRRIRAVVGPDAQAK